MRDDIRSVSVMPLGLRLTVLLVMALTGCSDLPGLHGRTVIGVGPRINVVFDNAIRPALADTVTKYAQRKHVQVVVRDDTSQEIAKAVDFGASVDVVVLAAGPPLVRVRDELASRPAPLGTYDGVFYWAAAVTDYGKRFVHFLDSRSGLARLRASGFTSRGSIG